MYARFGYSIVGINTVTHDVDSDVAWMDGLEACFDFLCDTVGEIAADITFDDACLLPHREHLANDIDLDEILWAVTARPMLLVLNGCQTMIGND